MMVELKTAFAISIMVIGAAGSAVGQALMASNSSGVATHVASFDVADVHPSPHVLRPFMDGGELHGDRYVIHQATMADLISTAYGVDSTNVQGGPSWLDWDRFEIVAKAPPTTSKADLRLMLQGILKTRFNLATHEGSAPMPAFVMKAQAGKVKMKEAQAAEGEGTCDPQPPPPNQAAGAIRQIVVICKNETMQKFAEDIHDMAGGYLDKPVVDSTGLKEAYDFTIMWTPRGLLGVAGADGISIFDAVDKQLGLKLALETAPRTVLIVDSVDKTPSANPPDLDKKLPALPPAQFEVATIKPSKPDTQPMGRVNNGEVDVHGLTVKQIISFAWDLNPNDSEAIVGPPKWLDNDKFDILAKVSTDDGGDAKVKPPQLDADELRHMLRALIEDRFKMKDHLEDRPVTAYTMKAVSPKLTAADPTKRTRCDEGPGPNGKDLRLGNAMINRLIYCQNVTLEQLGILLPNLAFGYIYYPVADGTGLKGSFDLTLAFSSVDRTLAPPPSSNSQQTGTTLAADPSGAVSLFDAFKNQLGLRLEKEKRPMPVLVIDHIEEQPTAN
ncbi:TIGR03435 family protein [Telmatobacter sp. DSM 110680]|uniref:TIGR03435 family protein n=1 Tax=Telmatobacter sp. DSM 110680 TaxID=3036704 RepID=A0AAU7DQ32_9BACT